jgi:hypothetical protein
MDDPDVTPDFSEPDEGDVERWRSMIRESLSGKERLTELEDVIERGLSNFIEVGRALTEIRDSKLYRETHPTFEAYCQERWGFSARRAYQLIEAKRTAGRLRTSGSQEAPMNERQARAIAHPPKPKAIEPPKPDPPRAADPAHRSPPQGSPAWPPMPSGATASPAAELIECPACHHKFEPKETK